MRKKVKLRKKRVVYIFFLLLFIFSIVEIKYILTDGFSVRKIAYDGEYDKKREVCEASKEIFSILEQDFSYLGKGRQCYVFESLDKKYVIKFSRFHKYRFPFWAEILSYFNLLTKSQKIALYEKEERHENAFKSYEIAYKELKDITKVLYVHLNQTDFLKKKIIVKDKLKRKHVIDLDKITFLIQKKTDLLEKAFLKIDEKENVQKLITSFFEALDLKIKNKIINKDAPNIIRNSGCENFKFIEIDVGSFLKMENRKKEFWNRNFISFSNELKTFLENNLPEYLPFFLEKQKEFLCKER